MNRELQKLVEKGLIHVGRCQISILDPDRLRNLR
ncbi:MAG: hypothetical protein DRI37_05770 [Chloroflexi bacterium]|nr:MAG: hypothetical protein DRI37_05770 [Chloroflexota bacterium]